VTLVEAKEAKKQQWKLSWRQWAEKRQAAKASVLDNHQLSEIGLDKAAAVGDTAKNSKKRLRNLRNKIKILFFKPKQ
jgi:hypothetical protein